MKEGSRGEGVGNEAERKVNEEDRGARRVEERKSINGGEEGCGPCWQEERLDPPPPVSLNPMTNHLIQSSFKPGL